MMSLVVKSKTEDSVKCEVVDGGELKSRRHLNVRRKSATLPSITGRGYSRGWLCIKECVLYTWNSVMMLKRLSQEPWICCREDVDVRFPRPERSMGPDNQIEIERQMKDMKWKKEKILEELKRERTLLDVAKFNFNKKKNDFL